MKKNMGKVDKVIRLLVATLIFILIFTGKLSGTTAIIFGAVGGIFIGTSLVGTCPLYLLFGLNTQKK